MATVKQNTLGQDYTNLTDGWDLTGGATPRKLTIASGNINITGDASGYQIVNKGVQTAVQYITLTSAYTTTSGSTALQKLFNAPANGTLTVGNNSSYFFECRFSLSAMSTSTGTFSFGLLGTATYTRVRYWSIALKGAVTPTSSQITLGTAATITAITTSTLIATGEARIRGKIVIGTGGTIIPAFAISVASAAVVAADSYFRIYPCGSNTVQSVGIWT